MKRSRRLLAAGLLAVVLATPAGAAEPAAIRRLRLDLRALATGQHALEGPDVAFAALLFAGLAVDDAGLAATGRHRLPDGLRHLERGGTVGSANAAGGLLIAGGLIAGERRGWTGGLTMLEANLLLGVTLDLAKSGFGRARPLGAHHGQLFRSGQSFPSSHAAHAFLIASVVDATLDRRWVSWTVYPLACLVSLSRVQNGAHYPTDIVAGAALGWWFGSRLSAAHDLGRRDPARPRITAMPIPGGAVATLHWRW
ncbi:MAG: phosphatase PAP2 family protein [Acidobacteria bacterium]|nr:phosphatase PAP2 family protein [Acidobacteriota bacterium]